MTDKLNPSHYKGFSNGAQVIDVIERLAYNRGAAVKYLARSGRKQGESAMEDLRKAEWHIQREIARIEKDGIEIPAKVAPFIWRDVPVTITPEARQ